MVKCTHDLIACAHSGAPAAPTNVRISSVTCTSVRVSWDGVDDATGYSVEWMLINDWFREVHGSYTVNTSITGITLTGLFESSQYSVEVTSIQNGVPGGNIILVTFTITEPVNPCRELYGAC